jgi:hypothetical protein
MPMGWIAKKPLLINLNWNDPASSNLWMIYESGRFHVSMLIKNKDMKGYKLL